MNASESTVQLGGQPLNLRSLRDVYRRWSPVAVSPECREQVRASHAAVLRAAAGSRPAYGINTGFGLLANTAIPADQLERLQRNIVLSHSSGVGPLLDDDLVRLVMVLKIVSLLRGLSGVSETVIERLVALVNAQAYPCIPAKGSVGASGDLAPLAHMSLVLLGEGQIRRNGVIKPAREALQELGLEPVTLGPKEGLALLNGTQTSTALALAGLFEIEDVFSAAVISGLLSVDALKGSDVPFNPRIHDARGQRGQIEVAKVYQQLLAGSEIRDSHRDCPRVQDPYSLRCQPQVMGASLDLLHHCAGVLAIEANAVTDNPLVFADSGEVVSGGNFHAEPVAFTADILAMAGCEIASIAERRIALLVDPKMSGLPAFLTAESGLNSGFMIPQVTAAALVAENRMLAHPASVDSIPTSANQEDHVSMATHGARRTLEIASNSRDVIAIELLAACQGLDFHRPLKTSAPLQRVHAALRERVPFTNADRLMADEVAIAREITLSPVMLEPCASLFESRG
ncbi:MAG TPA: histidine ammonia-lyase [Povalibacter sp.]|nr:histidine ammonia-lyase [Povalibacter sp.]